jgi:CheY-like chemotaxis protein/nitrogen-specific signal transduction histidine kinase
VIRSFVAVFDDVTEIRETESMLREAKERAEAGDRAKGQFLATMSHEVRTPLNGIVGFASLLLDTELTPEQQEFVATIRTSSETLIQLTGDILDYARIESGRLKLEPQPCDPRECVENALDLVAATAAGKNIELLHWTEESVPPAISVDVGRLRQVLVNLVNNAVKFTINGEVEVQVRCLSMQADPGTGNTMAVLEFSVRDTGIGIAVQHHARVFRPFTQVDESTTRRFGGTGLGLAICKNLVELMQGTISFTSELGGGSTFTFTICAPVHTTDIKPGTIASLKNQRVAVIVDHQGLSSEVTRLARQLGADVFNADMSALMNTSNWDMAIVDVNDAIAVEFAARAAPHSSLPPEKIIGLVSIAAPPELRTALRTHFRVLLNKPPHQDTLRGLLGTRASASPFVPPPPASTPPNFNLAVLIVEDNAVNQQLIQRVVSNLGCEWSTASNGRIALDHLSHATPDIVLMDLHMPEMDGLTAIKKIRAGEISEATRSVWIIALTADARAEQRERTLNAGANDYLTKPVRLPELMAAFERFATATKK